MPTWSYKIWFEFNVCSLEMKFHRRRNWEFDMKWNLVATFIDHKMLLLDEMMAFYVTSTQNLQSELFTNWLIVIFVSIKSFVTPCCNIKSFECVADWSRNKIPIETTKIHWFNQFFLRNQLWMTVFQVQRLTYNFVRLIYVYEFAIGANVFLKNSNCFSFSSF